MTWIALACGLALTVFLVLAYVRRWRWTGFAANRKSTVDDEDFQPAKTLWDWLPLFVIPIALAALAFLLNNSQSNREQQREDERAALQRETESQRAARQRAIATDTAREEALRAYVTQMSGLMLDRNLLQSPPRSNVRAVARTITLTALRRLDGERKGQVVQFLIEARLIRSRDPKVSLIEADLRSADLRGVGFGRVNLAGANLSGANLREAFLNQTNLNVAKLRGADLRSALLIRADLFNADLRRADLSQAFLQQVNFADARLRYADLRRAALGGVTLTGADISNANLSGADFRALSRVDARPLKGPQRTNLGGAFLQGAEYDSTTKWPPGFDPEAAGATRRP